MNHYTRLTQAEWDKTIATAKSRFMQEELGERPTRKAVAKTLHNKHAISVLEWLGLLLLVVIGIVTGYKMTAIAIPFAISFFPEGAVPPVILSSFVFFMSATFILVSTSGLVYFKLMDEYDPEIQAQKKKYPTLIFEGGWQGAVGGGTITMAITLWAMQMEADYVWASGIIAFLIFLYKGGLPVNLLQYASPRLYQWLTYITAVWLFMVSSEGEGSFFARYAIVLAEIALAYLVANLFEKRSKWLTTVYDAWQEAVRPYDERLENYWTDPKFLQLLYRQLRESLATLERTNPEKRNTKIRPNHRLIMQGEHEEVDRIILEEYTRMTGGLRFASLVANTPVGEETPVRSGELIEAGKRIPPVGDKVWKVDSLEQDFIVRGLQPSDDYTEKQLNEDYAADYDARKAFRDGARLYFTKYAQ